MFPSYKTVPLANTPKAERSSTPVPRMKKIAVAAMVGMALVVVGYSYGASTTHPAKIDIATTTTTTAANLIRGGSRKYGDACYNLGSNEEACTGREGCYWYPHWASPHGWCSSSPGVDCGGFRARDCETCPYYESINNQGAKYCLGDCYWDVWVWGWDPICEPA